MTVHRTSRTYDPDSGGPVVRCGSETAAGIVSHYATNPDTGVTEWYVTAAALAVEWARGLTR